MLLLKNVLHQDKEVDILIEGNRFSRIANTIDAPQATQIEAKGLAILPPFYNGHTHAAMTLLRGYANDRELFDWLHNFIWPAETKLTKEDIYAGVRLAILEMIKSGTVFFSDMYWMVKETLRAADEMGIRSAVGITIIDGIGKKGCEKGFNLLKTYRPASSRIQLTVAPHAIYTVSDKLLQRSHQEASQAGVKLHIHLSETKKEVNDCIAQHGCTPVEHLDRLRMLDSNTIAAHGVHLSDTDIDLLVSRGVTVVHNPVSNLKLSSGLFDLQRLQKRGCKVILGTDGASSNDNLSMIEEMKIAALLAKVQHSPGSAPVSEILSIATRKGAEAFDIDGGLIEEGRLADALLISLDNERMTPCLNLLSNWVYSADSSCINTVICDGQILMQDRKIANESEIIDEARRCAEKFKV